MSGRPGLLRGVASVAAGLPLLLSLTGCGSEEPPSRAVPALAARLDKVDAAIEDGSYERARVAVQRLVADAAQAELAGDITGDQADQILASARELLDALPAGGDDGGTPAPDPTPPATSTSPTDIGGDEGAHDGSEGHEEDD